MKNQLLLPAILYFLLILGCKKDGGPCQDVTCFNGTCETGTCICETGYTGTDCSQELKPVQMMVATIQITKVPLADGSGVFFDIGDAPDVYLEVENVTTGNSFTTDYFENLTGQTNYTVNWTVIQPTGDYVIRAWDYDGSLNAPDDMGGISFSPYIENGGFPDEITLDCQNCKVAFKLIDVTYTY